MIQIQNLKNQRFLFATIFFLFLPKLFPAYFQKFNFKIASRQYSGDGAEYQQLILIEIVKCTVFDTLCRGRRVKRYFSGLVQVRLDRLVDQSNLSKRRLTWCRQALQLLDNNFENVLYRVSSRFHCGQQQSAEK